jgi:hypothetical protein
VVAQVVRGDDAKGTNGRQRPRLRATQRVLRIPAHRELAFARVVHDFSLASARQIEIPHEDVRRIATARVSIALRPSLVIAITRVGF